MIDPCNTDVDVPRDQAGDGCDPVPAPNGQDYGESRRALIERLHALEAENRRLRAAVSDLAYRLLRGENTKAERGSRGLGHDPGGARKRRSDS